MSRYVSACSLPVVWENYLSVVEVHVRLPTGPGDATDGNIKTGHKESGPKYFFEEVKML
jgi:hypothetical protein